MEGIMARITDIVLTSTGVTEIDAGLNVIKTIGIGVCSVIGILGLIKGGIDFASGLSQRDQSGIVTGGLELGGGLVMAAIGVVRFLMSIHTRR